MVQINSRLPFAVNAILSLSLLSFRFTLCLNNEYDLLCTNIMITYYKHTFAE